MKLKERVQNSFFALSDNRLLGRKKLAISYVSLFLVFTLVLVTTVAWFTVKDTASINSQAFSLESSAALRVNDGQEDLSNHLVVKDFKLEEASSVDGRNMFFPSEGNFKDSTSAMKFREGTAGDRNKTYVYKDFKLNADSDMTNVYVKSYKITINDENGNLLENFDGSTEISSDMTQQVKHQECPLRIAFITDSAEKPILIDPTALVDRHSKTYNTVSSTNSLGQASTQPSVCQAFSDFYYFSGSSMFTLDGSKPLDVTLVAWFEGTGGNCDRYANASITMDIELESNWDNMEAVYFVDNTVGDGDENVKHWIDSNGACIVTMEYLDSDGSKKTVVMRKENSTYNGCPYWSAALPQSVVTNITFYRFSLSDNTIYNAWYTRESLSNMSNAVIDWTKNKPLQKTRMDSSGNRGLVYTATRGNGYQTTTNTSQRLSPCVGYWDIGSTGDSSQEPIVPPIQPSSDVKVGINLNIPGHYGGSIYDWIEDDVTKYDYTMYAYMSDGNSYEMTYENRVFKLENQSVPKNTNLVKFYEKKKQDGNIKNIPVDNTYIFSTSMNVTYEVTNNMHAKRTS